MKTLKQSLRKKPTYNEMVNYIEEDIPIRYPDRTATFLRNSHYLQQFDGDTFIDLEEQEKNIEKEKLKEMEVRKISAETRTTAQAVKANLTKQEGPKLNVSMIFDTDHDSGVEGYMSDREEEEQRELDDAVRKANERAAIGSRAVSEVAEQEQRGYSSFSLLTTPDRPSAQPLSESEYATPIAPRRLDEEFRTPSSNNEFKDTLRKKQEESSSKKKALEARVEKEKKEQEARAKAIAEKAEKHQKTKDDKSVFTQPSSSSSSSAIIETPTGEMKKPMGPKPVKARPISPDKPKQIRARSSASVEKALSERIDTTEIKQYKTKTELMKLDKTDLLIQIEYRKQALRTRGVEFDTNSTIAHLRKIVDDNKDLFLTSVSSPENILEKGLKSIKSAAKKITSKVK